MPLWLVTWTLAGALAASPDSLRRASLETALAAFGDAFARADAGALDTLLADDYVHTNGGSGTVLDKARWLAFIRQRRTELDSGRLRLDRYETSRDGVRWSPSVAVVTGQVTAEGVRDGIRFATRVRVTQVWMYENGRWRRVAFHDSSLPTP